MQIRRGEMLYELCCARQPALSCSARQYCACKRRHSVTTGNPGITTVIRHISFTHHSITREYLHVRVTSYHQLALVLSHKLIGGRPPRGLAAAVMQRV